MVSKPCTFTSIINRITTGQAGASGNIGIYQNIDVPNVLYPSGLLYETLPFQASTSATTITTSVVGSLSTGVLYWAAALCYAPGTNSTWRCIVASAGGIYPIFGWDEDLTASPQIGVSIASTFGTNMPDPFPPDGGALTGNATPAIGLRITS